MKAAAQVIAIAKPSDPAASLHAERERLVEQIGQIGRKLGKLREAETAEEAASAEVRRLGEEDISRTKAWVASGDMAAPRPVPDAAKRARLMEKMAAAVDASRAAKAVASEVESEALPLRARLVEIDSEILALRLSTLGVRRSTAAARSIAADLAPRKIRVNVVAPGATKTPIWKRGARANATAEESAKVSDFFPSTVPLARWGEPEDVAKAVLFLASDDSSYINAVELMVDGGLTGAPFGAPILRG